MVRWRVLLWKNEGDKEYVRTATLACMVLHNVCLVLGDSIPRKLDLTVGLDGKERANRDEIRKLLLMRECRRICLHSNTHMYGLTQCLPRARGVHSKKARFDSRSRW